MSESNYSLLLLEQNKPDKEDDSEYDMKLYKKNAKYNFEKFKPKTKVKDEENELALKGAENQVKFILSNYLRNFQSKKNNNSDIVSKQISSLKNNIDIEGSSSRKKSIKKIRTIVNKNYLPKSSFKNNNAFMLNKNDNINQIPKGGSPKVMYSHKNMKKVNFSVSPRNKRKKMESQKMGNFTYFKFNNGNKANIEKIETIPEFNYESFKTTNDKVKKFASGKNTRALFNKMNSIKNNNTLGVNSLIKKTQTQRNIKNVLNFKNDEFNSKNNDDKEKINKQFSSFKSFVNNIKNNLIQFNKSKIPQESTKKVSIKKLKLNRMNTQKNIKKYLPNVSTKVQRCLSPKSKRPSLFRRQQMQMLNEKNRKYSDTQKKEITLKGSNDFRKLSSSNKMKRSETSKNIFNRNSQIEDQSKFLKLISDFKMIKQKIRKSIILRPEDQEESSNNILKQKSKKNATSDKIINLKNVINDEPIKDNNDVERSNTIIYKGDQNKKFLDKTEEEKNKDNLNLETEIKETIEKQQTEKSESFQEQYSFHSIKRKTVLHLEKYRNLVHKGNIYDSLDDEELEDEEDISRFYIDPNSIFCFTFDLIIFIINIITFFELPLYLAMNLNFCKAQKFSMHDTINSLTELLNILDFFFGFFRAYYNWEEQLVKKNGAIAKRYLLGWFLFDLISAIPVYTLLKSQEPICDDKYITSYYNVTLDNFHYLFLCNRLLKMLKIFGDNQAWKIISNKLSDFWSLIFNICLILLGLNYTACLYIFIARNSYPNWILKAKVEVSEFKNVYICSIYILLMALTTVGYGDITCSSFQERIFQVFLLIIGIIAYSWLVSSFSNFVKKINEKSVDYEKKKSILDEIRINNPNLPDDLYDRILRYLKFRHFHEKNMKNIIFDCLPVGLKNNLIYEMYKPIIKNFIFFKNFQNTDFIVQVILSFKPILAFKNYILVNEDDLIEEIIFVKNGVLSVELPINMTNPQENIDKYLSIPNPEKEKMSTKKGSKTHSDILGSFLGDDTPKKLHSLANSSTVNSSFIHRTSFFQNPTVTKIKPVKIKKVYVKILGIRENEHFGDVLMFLEERSPLRVRVRSKKCELFFLKKIDALKISTAYPNIWRRINKKSVYNFKQIKKNIKKIVQIYCSVKKVDDKKSDETETETETNSNLLFKKSSRWIRKNNEFNNSALNSTNRRLIERRNLSEENIRIRNKNLFFQKYGINDEYFEDINIKNITKEIKKCYSVKIPKTNFNALFDDKSQVISTQFSFSDSSSSSVIYQKKKKKTNKANNQNNNKRTKKKKLTKKLMDVFNRNYMYYKGLNKNNKDQLDSQISIIAEETDKDCSLNPMLKSTNNSMYKNSMNSKARILTQEEDEKDTNPINKKYKKKHKKHKGKSNEVQQSLISLTDIKMNNYETLKNKEILFNSSEDVFSEIDEENKINTEIYPDELIQITNGENLLQKKFDINKQYDIEKNFKISSNIEQNRNRELAKLLKYFDEESKSIQNKITIKESSHFKSSNEKSRKVNDSNKLIFDKESDSSSESNKSVVSAINLNFKSNWDNNTLSINRDITLNISSSYENYNIISGAKLIKSKVLQNKLKTYLINEIANLNKTDEKIGIKKLNTQEESNRLKEEKRKPILKNYSHQKRTSSSIVYNTTNINYINSVSIAKNKPRRFLKKSSSLIERVAPISIDNYSENSSAHFAKDKKKGNNLFKNDDKPFENEFYGRSAKNTVKFNFNPKLAKKKQSEPLIKIKSSNNVQLDNISHHRSINLNEENLTGRALNYETAKDIPRKGRVRRHSVLITSGISKVKKKKDDLLSLIDYNIQRTNQKLNDPEQFYSSYFNDILKEEMKEKNKKKA